MNLIKSLLIPCGLGIFCLLLAVSLPAQTIQKGNIRFSFDLYRQLSQFNPDQNLVFSPWSISTAFSVPYAGTKGLTSDQIASVFYYDADPGQTLKSFQQLNLQLEQSKGVIFKSVNNFWLDHTLQVRPEFNTLLDRTFDGSLQRIDFKQNALKSTATINQWIAQHTENQIQNLLQEDDLNDLTRFIITNAVYFKGNWMFPFDKKLTADDLFTLANGQKIQTTFIKKTAAPHLYFEDDEVQVIDLPYQGGDLSMMLILPRFKDQLPKIEAELTSNRYETWLKRMTEREVIVTIPKFKLSVKLSSLRDDLRKMGVKEVFTFNSDFSPLSMESLRLAKVAHQAFLEVKEEGTEASASTAIIGMGKGILSAPPAYFNANQPFLFLLRSRRNNLVLFMGRFTQPSAETAVTSYEKPLRPQPFISENIAAEEASGNNSAPLVHEVAKGESLFYLSKRYQIPVGDLRKINQLESDNIQVGQKLLVRHNTTDLVKGQTITSENVTTHTVKPNETLFGIAKKHNIDLPKLRTLNNLTSDVITVGQTLNLTSSVVQPTLPQPLTEKYIVQRGDTLFAIARNFNISVQKLRTSNQLNSDVLSIGQELVIVR